MRRYVDDLKFKIDLNEDFNNKLFNFQGNYSSITSSLLSKLIPSLDKAFIQKSYFNSILIQNNLTKKDRDFLKKVKLINRESTLAIGLLINRICKSIKKKPT